MNRKRTTGEAPAEAGAVRDYDSVALDVFDCNVDGTASGYLRNIAGLLVHDPETIRRLLTAKLGAEPRSVASVEISCSFEELARLLRGAADVFDAGRRVDDAREQAGRVADECIAELVPLAKRGERDKLVRSRGGQNRHERTQAAMLRASELFDAWMDPREPWVLSDRRPKSGTAWAMEVANETGLSHGHLYNQMAKFRRAWLEKRKVQGS